jgi:hypothetical protein
MPILATFLNLILGVTLFIAAAYGLRRLWVRAVPPKILAWLIAPGVAVHELSHAVGCLLTGAKIHSMVLFRPDGSGEVRHGPPKLPYVGTMIIALAPLAGGVAALVLLGMLLDAPINPYRVKADRVQPDQFVFMAEIARLVLDDLRMFLKGSSFTDWRTYVFLYFAMCFTLTMAPSKQDLKNGAGGILILCGLAFLAHLVVDRLIQARGDGPVFQFMGSVLVKLHYPFAIAAVSAIVGGLLYGVRWLMDGQTRRRRRR